MQFNLVNNTAQKTSDKQMFVDMRSKWVWTFCLRNLCQPFYAWVTIYLQDTAGKRISVLLFILVTVHTLLLAYFFTLLVIIRRRHQPANIGGIQNIYKVLFLRPPMGKIGRIREAHERGKAGCCTGGSKRKGSLGCKGGKKYEQLRG